MVGPAGGRFVVIERQFALGLLAAPERFRNWDELGPSADHSNRLVCISRDVPEEDIAITLPALNTPAGTQAHYSMQELRQRYAQR